MPQNSAYCKAYTADKFRQFPGWVANTVNLRKRKKQVEGKEVEYSPTAVEDDHILYLHDSYVVTDGVFNDENVIFDKITEEWKRFCSSTLGFKVPDYCQPTAA